MKESLLTIGLRGTGSAWHPRRRRVRAPTLHLNILKNQGGWPPRYPVDYIFSRWGEEPTWLLTVKMWQISWSLLLKVLIMGKIWLWWDFCKTFGQHITVWSVGLLDNLENACFILGKEGSNLLASEPLVLNWLGGRVWWWECAYLLLVLELAGAPSWRKVLTALLNARKHFGKLWSK